VCTNDVAVEVGRTVYTGVLDTRGGYEADVTVTRTGPEDFLVVSSAATTVRDLDWLRRHLPPDVVLEDLTDDLAVLGVMGPRSRHLLGALTAAGLDGSFPFGTSREVDLGGARVRATRMTYVGELGWELMIPVADAGAVFEALVAEAAAAGIECADAGYSTIESMRLECGYRAFGRELTPEISPVAAGLTFACKLRSDVDFLGRAALEAERARGPARRIVSLGAGDPEAFLWGGELVLRDGVPAGQVTSAAFGAVVGASVGLALVGDRASGAAQLDWVRSGEWTADHAGRRVPRTVTTTRPREPTGSTRNH
jgi:4-methylaminobutanoate oxidase (formaldehyde-forming)